MPLRAYDETISVLKSAVQRATLARDEELAALNRLDNQARLLRRTGQRATPGADYRGREEALTQIWGRTVFGFARSKGRASAPNHAAASAQPRPPLITGTPETFSE